MAEDQTDIHEFLKRPENFGPGAGDFRCVQTHCATVFLGGDRAFKLKKPVRYAYLDFSTVAKRKAACAAELALNSQSAPKLYVGMRGVGRNPSGQIAWDAQPVLDWVIEMRRFPDDALLAHVAERGGLDLDLCVRLADRIADQHDQTPPLPRSDGAAMIRRSIAGIAEALAQADDGGLGERRRAGVIDSLMRAAEDHAALIDRRAASGQVRHCHGDLHLANICLFEGEPTLFDALEFDPNLATIDVLYDLAFLLMDVTQRGLQAQASAILNRYLDRRDEQDGLCLLPLFMAMRAAIRAYTSLAAGSIAAAKGYLDHASRCLQVASPILIAIGGLSGSGKSRLGRDLAALSPGVAGARHLRSDILRKILAGVPPEQRLPAHHYTAAMSARIYEEMRRRADELLRDGISVICDAVHAKPLEREAIEAVARQSGYHFVGIWLEAPAPVMSQRIDQRRHDASDATSTVLQEQLTYNLGEIRWHRIDTTGAAQAVTDAAAGLLA